MRPHGEVLLVSCYELGHQPIGISSPLGFLEQAGYQPDVLDLSIQNLDLQKVRRARLVAISVPMHTALRIGTKVATRIRETHPSCHITFYGLYASLNAETLLADIADSVIGGEFETALVSLIDSVSQENEQVIGGVSTSKQISKPFLRHLPYVLPSRKRLPPLKQYAHLEEGGNIRPVGYVETSHGCRYSCRHCPIPPVYEGRFFLVPREIVLADIRQLVAMGASHITFGDPDFLNGPGHSLRIVRLMHDAFPELTFDFTAKIEHLLRDHDHLPELRELGCIFIISAVESLNNTVLSNLDKNHTRDDVVTALQLTRNAGITLRPSLVPFTPWTTLEDMIELFHFVEKERLIDHLDPVQYTIRLLIPPGSLLLTEPSITPCLGELVKESFTYQWSHPDPRIDRLQTLFSEEVEEGTKAETDSEVIFYQLKEFVEALHEGRPPVRIMHPVKGDRVKPPRLTEAWFCCAEPTKNQFAAIESSKNFV